MSHPSAFKSPRGEALFLAAYDASMTLWPVPYEELDLPSRFGSTHVIVSGHQDAPPLVLLHGYMATSTMWSLNIADVSEHYRVYAIDVMGQQSKSYPDQPIRCAADFAVWLTETLNELHLDRVFMAGMSFGAWLTLTYAVAAPERLRKIVLLSPAGGVLPIVKQFALRGLLMLSFPTRFTVNLLMDWVMAHDDRSELATQRVYTNILDLMYLGLRHFRLPPETLRVMPTVFSDAELQGMRVPTLVLIGDHEVIYDPAAALARARRLIPEVEGDLVPHSSHGMCISQRQLVDARMLEFLKMPRLGDRSSITECSMA